MWVDSMSVDSRQKAVIGFVVPLEIVISLLNLDMHMMNSLLMKEWTRDLRRQKTDHQRYSPQVPCRCVKFLSYV